MKTVAACRAARVQQVLREAGQALTVRELSDRAGVPLAGLYGLCSGWLKAGFVTRASRGTYALGPVASGLHQEKDVELSESQAYVLVQCAYESRDVDTLSDLSDEPPDAIRDQLRRLDSAGYVRFREDRATITVKGAQRAWLEGARP